MTQPADGQKKSFSRFFPDRQSLPTLILLLPVWYFLAGENPKSWVVGLPSIFVALYLLKLLPPTPIFPISLAGLFAFVPYFLLQSVLSGVDVLRRVFSPSMPISPGLLRYESMLPAGAPQLFFVNTISLLPGTLSVELQRQSITVHTLDQKTNIRADLKRLESHIARLFKVTSIPHKGETG